MPPKRARKKSKALKVERSENDECDEKHQSGLNHTILLNPTLKIKEIVELGSSATLRKWSANFSENLDWFHAQKGALKDILRNAGVPEKSVPKTPRRGAVAFARLRETAESYTNYSLIFEDRTEKENEEIDGQVEYVTTELAAVEFDLIIAEELKTMAIYNAQLCFVFSWLLDTPKLPPPRKNLELKYVFDLC
ncbi:unnamed protein product [Strongylus vulgaris]|uniref:Uncharacterized protein n=1 Tax=Strongylus vulgaris TaxID=40348 RepID=A0A3P7JLR2_STRVU|nr:unnamed protein product [Strongylus vulgaris]